MLQHNGRFITKRIHVRIEHVAPSRCHDEFLRRCKSNDEVRHAAKVAGTPAPSLKRVPKGPRTEGFTLENVSMETMTAVPYDILKVRKIGQISAGKPLIPPFAAQTPLGKLRGSWVCVPNFNDMICELVWLLLSYGWMALTGLHALPTAPC